MCFSYIYIFKLGLIYVHDDIYKYIFNYIYNEQESFSSKSKKEKTLNEIFERL